MKKILMIAGAVLLVVLISAASFWGGMAYQSNQTSQARANFVNARGQANGGQIPDNGQLPSGGMGPGFFGGGGATGEVKTIEGNVMTLSTAQNVTTVNLSESTQIEKSVSGATSDLQPGMRVIVSGQTDSDGNITASRIQILDNSSPDVTNPPGAGTEP